MELLLDRKYKLNGYTIGKLYIDGVYFCDTLEDTDRGLTQEAGPVVCRAKKRKGQTAIPTGRYRVTLDVQSPRFSKVERYKFCKGYLPRLLNVPAYDGVLIHIGNYPQDTEGCILVGYNTVKGAVMNSTDTFKRLYAKLQKADGFIFIKIV